MQLIVARSMSSKELTQIHQQWLSYCSNCGDARDVSNPVMVAVCLAVFDCLMHKIRQQHKWEETEKLIPQPEQDIGMYYRFGSAALSIMLHLRYNKLTPNLPESDRERLEWRMIYLFWRLSSALTKVVCRNTCSLGIRVLSSSQVYSIYYACRSSMHAGTFQWAVTTRT